MRLKKCAQRVTDRWGDGEGIQERNLGEKRGISGREEGEEAGDSGSRMTGITLRGGRGRTFR